MRAEDELGAKPGNVHVFANGRRWASRILNAAPLPCGPLSGQGVGADLGAVDATASGRNKHKSRYYFTVRASRGSAELSYDLRSSLSQALRSLDRDDAELSLKPLYVHRQLGWEGRAPRCICTAIGTLTRPWPRRRDRDQSLNSM